MKGDKQTSYEVFPMPDIPPVDMSEVEKPEFLGTVIMDKDSEEMDYYLAYGSFPEEESDDAPRRQSNNNSRRGESAAP